MVRLALGVLVLALSLSAAACGGGCCDDPGPVLDPPVPGDALPAFRIPDVNDTSATWQALVSPRDHVGRVSAWYFGHAT